MNPRPSGSKVWLACPLGLTMQHLYGDRYPAGAAADEGTAAHWVLEHLLGEVDRPEGVIHAPNGVKITEDMVRHAQDAADVVVGIAAGGAWRTEHKLTLNLPDGVTVSGTADVIVLPPDGKTVHVIDYKYGHTHVPADSPQLKIYGIAAAQEFNRETVVLHVIQPRDYTAKPTRSYHFTPAQQNDFCTRVSVAMRAARADKPVAVPGSHCLRCPGRGHCNTLRDAAATLWGTCPTDTTAPEAVAGELAILGQAVELMTARLKGLQDEAAHVIGSGGVVPGWALERKPGRERWKGEAEVLALADGFGLLDTVSERKLITPNQAIKAGLPAELVRMHTERPMGEAKLVPSGDTLAARVFSTGA